MFSKSSLKFFLKYSLFFIKASFFLILNSPLLKRNLYVITLTIKLKVKNDFIFIIHHYRQPLSQPNSIVTSRALPDFGQVDVPISLAALSESISAPLVPPAATSMPIALNTTVPAANSASSVAPSTSSEATPSSSAGPASSSGGGQ